MKYPGGFFEPAQSLFEELARFGIEVEDEEHQFYDYFCFIDFEAMLVKTEVDDNNNKRQWTAEHIPISVSVCSNVPGHTEPECFVEENLDMLLGNMLGKMNTIQETSCIFNKWKIILLKTSKSWRTNKRKQRRAVHAKKAVDNLYYLKFESYCNVLPCFSYNGSNYDLNLVKSKLAKHLNLCDSNEKHFHCQKKQFLSVYSKWTI